MKEHHSGSENSSDRLPPNNQQEKPDVFPDAASISEESALTVPRFGLGDNSARQQHEKKHLSPKTTQEPLADVESQTDGEEETLEKNPEEPEVLLGEVVPESEEISTQLIQEPSLTASSSDENSNASAPPPGGNGGGRNGSGSEPEEAPDPNAPRGSEQDLWSHLTELRTRILYSIAAVALMSVVTWNFGQEISAWFAHPIRSALEARDVDFKLVTLNPTEGFLVYFQITIVSAILIAMPFILYQMWRFLEPALTGTERRFTQILLPFSVLLFFMGCGLGYAVAPLFFRFFLLFQPPGTDATFSYSSSIVLLAKMILVFGLCFQVPIITIFLNKIGVISRNFLIDYWRHAVVLIFLIVAVLTPTWDPVTLIVCAGPPCLLYGLSIWIMKWL